MSRLTLILLFFGAAIVAAGVFVWRHTIRDLPAVSEWLYFRDVRRRDKRLRVPLWQRWQHSQCVKRSESVIRKNRWRRGRR